MISNRIWRYRFSRALGRTVTRAAAALTFGQMPPFVSTSAIVTHEDDVLVVLDPIRREPVLPGGHLKWSEDPRDAVVREVREETGYMVEPGQLLGVFAGKAWAGEDGVVRVIYDADLRGGTLSSSCEGEAFWMSRDVFAGSSTRDACLVKLWLSRRAHSG